MEKKELINFYIPDFYNHFYINTTLIDLIKEHPDIFYDDFKVGAIYGNFPGAIWGGGARFQFNRISKEEIQQFSTFFYEKNIPLRLAFTNLALTKEHLKDDYCNMITQLLHNGKNEIIVASPILEEYLRENYPNYKFIRSTCAAKNIFYDDSEKYSMSVLNWYHNNDMELLKSIKNKHKIEFVTNETCNPNCNYAWEHYLASSKNIIDYKSGPNCLFSSKEDGKIDLIYQLKKRGDRYITPEKLRKILYPMGFLNFKLVGRGLPDYFLIEMYAEYMVKPEYRIDFRLYLDSVLHYKKMIG